MAVGATTGAIVKTAIAVGSAVKGRKDKQKESAASTKAQNQDGYTYGASTSTVDRAPRAGAALRNRRPNVRVIVWAPLVLGFLWALRK